jgi:hypothetical protein
LHVGFVVPREVIVEPKSFLWALFVTSSGLVHVVVSWSHTFAFSVSHGAIIEDIIRKILLCFVRSVVENQTVIMCVISCAVCAVFGVHVSCDFFGAALFLYSARESARAPSAPPAARILMPNKQDDHGHATGTLEVDKRASGKRNTKKMLLVDISWCLGVKKSRLWRQTSSSF